jgi:hypothetical protein
MRLKNTSVSLSTYKKPPSHEIPSIRSQLLSFFQEECEGFFLKKDPHLLKLNFDSYQLSKILSCTNHSVEKFIFNRDELIDIFYILSESHTRFLKWKYYYLIWTEELLFWFKCFLVISHQKINDSQKAFFILENQLIQITFNQSFKKNIFIDALGHRFIISKDDAIMVPDENQSHKILHESGIMKKGKVSAVDQWQNFSVMHIKNKYHLLARSLFMIINKLRGISNKEVILRKFKGKINYLFSRSLLLTCRKKCSISNCKAEQLS